MRRHVTAYGFLSAALVVFAVKTCVAAGPFVRRVALVRAAKP